MNPRILHVLLSSLWIFSSSCGSESHEGHSHSSTAPPQTDDSHAHDAPHGGTLVPIGDHLYNLELVLDRAAGKLELYVLGPHAHDPVRLSQESIAVVLNPNSEAFETSFRAQANTLSGERAGSTSFFVLKDELLTFEGPLEGRLGQFIIKGLTVDNLTFELPGQ